MKKLALFGLMCTFCVTNLFAGNPVSVKSGDISVLKKLSKAQFVVDYSNTKVGDQTLEEYLKGRGEDWVRDWPRDKETAASYFKTRFNKKSKGMKIVTDVSNITHKIVIHVNVLDVGNAFGTFLPMAGAKAGGVIMTGTIDVIDLEKGEVECVLFVDEVKGKGHMFETARLGLMYDMLAKQIWKLK